MRKLATLVGLAGLLYGASYLASRTTAKVEDAAVEECSCPTGEEESEDILIGDDVEGDELALEVDMSTGYETRNTPLQDTFFLRGEYWVPLTLQRYWSEDNLITPNGEGLMCYDIRFPISSCDTGIAIPLDNPAYFTLQDCDDSLLEEDKAEYVRGALESLPLESSYFKMLLKENAY